MKSLQCSSVASRSRYSGYFAQWSHGTCIHSIKRAAHYLLTFKVPVLNLSKGRVLEHRYLLLIVGTGTAVSGYMFIGGKWTPHDRLYSCTAKCTAVLYGR